MNLNETPEGYKQYYLFDHPVKDPKEFEKAAPYNNALRVSLQNIPNAAGKTFYMYTAAKNPRLAGVVNVTKQDNGICEFDFVPQTEEDSEVTPNKNERPLAESSIRVGNNKLTVKKIKTENPNDPVSKKAHRLDFYLGKYKIATISISAVDSSKAFLYDFDVDEKYRNQGIGTEILKYVLKHYKVNELTVDKDSKAINLYKRFGFKEGTSFREDGVDRVDMKIDLNEGAVKWEVKGKPVPKVCPKCGSKVGIFLHGEPIFQCTNKGCKKIFGVVPFTNENALTASGRRPKNLKEEETDPTTLESMIEFAKSHGMTPIIEEYVDEELDESMDFEKTYKLKSTPTTWDDFKTYWMEKRKIFRSNVWDDREVSKEEFVVYQQSYDIMCKPDVDYDQYKDAFDRFCVLFDILPETTIIENLHFESEDNEYRILMRYSTGTVKVHIPDDIDLLHVSPAKDIDILIPTFKSKTEGKYFYPNKRVYFTVGNKRIPSKKSGLEDIKVYRYEPTEHISEAYIDPTYTQFSVGAVFVRTENPIDVEVQTKLSKMNEAVEKKRTKEDVLKDHLKINAMAYNGILYIPEYMESIKKLYGYPIFDFFYPSLKIFTLQSRKATSLGGLWNGTQYNAKTNWYKASVNDQNHIQFAKEVGTLLDKILSGSMIEPGDLDIATEWLDEVEYHHSLLNEVEPYSSKYFYECQYLHDLFWDPFDDPRDSGVIAQNIVSVVRQIVPEVFGNINEHDGLVTKQSLQKYLADEISDKSIFLLPDKKLYPILDRTSLKLAMDSILQVADSDKKEFIKNLNAKMKENGYPYSIPIDHPYAKYAPKEIIIPIMMVESMYLYEEYQTDSSTAFQQNEPESKTPYVHRVEYNWYDPNLMDLKRLPSDEDQDSVTEPS